MWTLTAAPSRRSPFRPSSLPPNADPGQPAVAYVRDGVKYAEFRGSQWKREEVGPGDTPISLGFTTAGEPAICYSNERPDRRSDVLLAIRRGGTWNRAWIAIGHSADLTFSPAGDPAISYCDAESETVMFALFFDRSWHHFMVEQPHKTPTGVFVGPFMFTSLAFSPSGQPAISYYDRETAPLDTPAVHCTSKVCDGLLCFDP